MSKIYKETNESEIETTVNVLYGENKLIIYTNKASLQRQLNKILGVIYSFLFLNQVNCLFAYLLLFCFISFITSSKDFSNLKYENRVDNIIKIPVISV